MNRLNKFLSMLLLSALLLCSIFTSPVIAEAKTVMITNNFDDEGLYFETRNDSQDLTVHKIGSDGSFVDNWYALAAWTSTISECTVDESAGNAAHFVRAKGYDNLWPAAVKIYDLSKNNAIFYAEANKTYEIKLRYYAAATPDRQVNLQLRQRPECESIKENYAQWTEDYVLIKELAVITEATDGWVEASATFTVGDKNTMLNLSTASATTTAANNVDIWVDDIVIAECKDLVVNNYDGKNTGRVPVSALSTIADLEIPEREGYIFLGVYADAEYTNKINTYETAANYAEVYYKWHKLSDGEYYAGFENYKTDENAKSYNPALSAVVKGNTYSGNYMLNTNLKADEITAVEIRDKAAFDIDANTEYTVSFAYKTSGNIELGIGMAKANNVPLTAYALEEVALSKTDEWKTVSVTITTNNDSSAGFVLAFVLYAKEDAQIYIDDVYVTYPFDDTTVNMPAIDGFENAWYPALDSFDSQNEIDSIEIWDGTVAEGFAGGTGTEADPYLISNGKELALAITQGGVDEPYFGAFFKITKDIYLNDKNAADWSTGTANSGYTLNSWYTQAQPFSGTIDGNNHTIYGLFFHEDGEIKWGSSTHAVALVPVVATGGAVSISNLGYDYSYIRCRYGAAAFVGIGACSIDNCYVGENVYLTGRDTGAFVAKAENLVDKKIAVSNSYSLATLNGIAYGLVGFPYHSWIDIDNCYIVGGPVTSYTERHWLERYQLNNVYQTVDHALGGSQSSYTNVVVLTDINSFKGQDALSSKMPYLNASNAFVATDGYPMLKSFVKVEKEYQLMPDNTVIWDGKSTAPASTATGNSPEDPILITNGAELHYIIRTTGGEGKYYKLTNDIYLNDISQFNWDIGTPSSSYKYNSWFGYWNSSTSKPGTPFSGHIDGDNHVIYGMYFEQETTNSINLSDSGAALIPQIAAGASASIKNLGIDYAFMHYNSSVGGFVGAALTGSTLTIDNCFLGSEAILVGPHTGAFCFLSKDATTTVTNSYSLAEMRYTDSTGLVSQHWFGGAGTITVKNCYNGNGPIISYLREATLVLENCFQTVAGKGTTGVTTLSSDNMKGADSVTNDSKLGALNYTSKIFAPTIRNFAEYDYYTYLPSGTTIDSSLKVLFFDNMLAPISGEDVLFGERMTRGAYVKFLEKPDETLVRIPASVVSKVHAGSASEILNARPDDFYFDFEYEIATEIADREGKDSTNYIFITDLHNGYGNAMDFEALQNQLKWIVKMANENDNIDFVCLGGDLTNGTESTKDAHLTLLNELFTPLAECTKPVLVLNGNHDDNSYGNFKLEKVLTGDEWNDVVINTIVNRDGISVVQDSDMSNGPSKYYYYDLVGKKTRVVCLDAANYPYEWDEANGKWTLKVKNANASGVDKYYNSYNYWGYSARQLQWLTEEALTCEDGWDYIFLSHIGIDDEAANSNIDNFTEELREVIDAYQNKKKYVNNSIGVDVDFTNTTGKILSYQYGHTHEENTTYYEELDLWHINTSTASTSSCGDFGQTLKTETEAYFDVIFASRSDIYKHNIGSGYDLRMINSNNSACGDINLDNTVDICDLVAFRLMANGYVNKTCLADADKDNKIILSLDGKTIRDFILIK